MPSGDNNSVELLQGTLDLIVLRALSTMGALHSYALANRLAQVSDHPLSLNQGTTRWENTGFPTRPKRELLQRARWAREVLATRLQARTDLVEAIELKARGSDLGPAYENGNVVAFEYSLEELPSDEVLVEDLTFLVSVLSELYEIVTPDGERVASGTNEEKLQGLECDLNLTLSDASEKDTDIEINCV